ncbi:pseudouridine synthase [Nonlabens tegetincola]|uniref:pseudouridine synthase n=1 Tax=Nonlabens tegetincola TaxID=323273 RepID=UPI000A20920A|nr:pseudouridine synthase [Nonlabens tegetincola]ARN71912.1 pseudouridine synthase [Nonlabens tegetincola]
MNKGKGGRKGPANSNSKSKSTRNTRGGKNQIIGTSRTGKPVTKKQYIKRKKNESSSTSDDTKGIRLNKYIANSGICSRREADVFIAAGSVFVNDKPVTEMGYRVQPDDQVKFDGQSITPRRNEYYLLNKPKGFITANKGDKASKTVDDLMRNASGYHLHHVGKLNRTGLGLMIFTTDIKMANKLNNPNLKLKRLYQVTLERSLKHADLLKIREGLIIDGQEIHVNDINYIENGRSNEIGIELSINKESIVKEIFESLDYSVSSMDVVMIHGLTKKDLPRGHYRKLTQQEVINLQMLS